MKSDFFFKNRIIQPGAQTFGQFSIGACLSQLLCDTLAFAYDLEGIDPDPSPEEEIRNPDSGVFGLEPKPFETLLNSVYGILRKVTFVVFVGFMLFRPSGLFGRVVGR